MKSCSRYHGPILQVDPVVEENEASVSGQASVSMAVDSSESSQESGQFVELKAGPSQNSSDVEMKGLFRTISYDSIRVALCYD